MALKLGCGRSSAATHHAGFLQRVSRSCKRREASALVEGVMMAIITPTAMPLAKCRGVPHQLWLRSRTATRLTGWHCIKDHAPIGASDRSRLARLYDGRIRRLCFPGRMRHAPKISPRDSARIAKGLDRTLGPCAMKADRATCCAGVTDRARDHHHGPLDANLELLFCDPGRFNFTPKVRLAAR
jgi:hypothetical protein